MPIIDKAYGVAQEGNSSNADSEAEDVFICGDTAASTSPEKNFRNESVCVASWFKPSRVAKTAQKPFH